GRILARPMGPPSRWAHRGGRYCFPAPRPSHPGHALSGIRTKRTDHHGRTIMTTPPASVDTLKAIAAAFNAHDLDAIMDFFADDCILEMPRGPEPWGQRFTGKAAVREGLASRFKGLPDVQYGGDRHLERG